MRRVDFVEEDAVSFASYVCMSLYLGL